MYIDNVPNYVSMPDIKSKLPSLGITILSQRQILGTGNLPQEPLLSAAESRITITKCKRMGRISTFNTCCKWEFR